MRSLGLACTICRVPGQPALQSELLLSKTGNVLETQGKAPAGCSGCGILTARCGECEDGLQHYGEKPMKLLT